MSNDPIETESFFQSAASSQLMNAGQMIAGVYSEPVTGDWGNAALLNLGPFIGILRRWLEAPRNCL